MVVPEGTKKDVDRGIWSRTDECEIGKDNLILAAKVVHQYILTSALSWPTFTRYMLVRPHNIDKRALLIL